MYTVCLEFRNYSCRNTKNFVNITKETLDKFLPLIKAIKANKNNFSWNWLTEQMYEEMFDIEIENILESMLDIEIDIETIKEFYNTFTPMGAGGIISIEVLKYEPINL